MDLELKKREVVEELKSSWDTLTYQEKQKASIFIQSVLIEKARVHFPTYVELMAPEILPEGFIDGKHIQYMARKLQKIEQRTAQSTNILKRKESKNKETLFGARWQLFMPPGSMKSKILNMFVTWVLGRHPKWNILHLGHSTDFAQDNMGRQIRDLMSTAEYSQIFPNIHIRADVKAAGRWWTNKGGMYYCTGVGGKIAGRRAHISICDDALDEQTAKSDTERPKINRWYGSGLRTRLLSGASEVIVNTRWHIDDLSGYLLKADVESSQPWEVTSFPAFLDKESSKLLDLPEGHSFWPEMWSDEALSAKKDDATLTAAEWAALYMQSPIPEEGSIFKESEFKPWLDPEPPLADHIIMSVDTAFSTRESADYSAYSVWGVFKSVETNLDGREIMISNAILLESGKGRWDFPTLCQKVQEVNDIYEPDTLLVEKKGSGMSLIQEMRRRDLPIVEYVPDKDKVSRAHAITPFCRAGRIWLPAKKLTEEEIEWRPFVDEFLEEILQFPYAEHDDLTDTFTQAILWLRDIYSVSHSEYPEDDEDEDDRVPNKRVTYWNLVNPRG